MNIAEKVLRLKQDFDDVYEAGKNAGGGSSIDENTIIEKTVSGKSVVLQDVSEVPHDINVKLTSDTITNFSGVTVTKYSKNLYDGQSAVTVNGGYTALNVNLKAGNTYVISATVTSTDTDSIVNLVYDLTNGLTIGYMFRDNRSSLTIVATKDIKKIALYASNNVANGTNDTASFSDIQIEIGGTMTDYESYKEPVTIIPNVDGIVEGIEYEYPFLRLESNNENVLVNVTYNKSYGIQKAYDEFWCGFQQGGNKSNYWYAFIGNGWNDYTYNPKYPIKLWQHRSNIMYQDSLITDTKVPIIVTVSPNIATTATMEQFYNATYLKTIREFRLERDVQFSNVCFNNCKELVNITFTGVGKIISAINFQWCPLSKESIISVVNALSDTTSGLTATFKKTAKEAAFTTDEWSALTATKSNWEFVLS